ncbi:muramoyltetrapeptide carboxypeptidase [Actimicrobium antarcticum]|uniref:Muramoyltetrapeptide carboxypeptidase n=1 Tax=Actimicrobium antarcticum TaxID=1051899 RepID=A0ABP7SGG3_9BURK
MTESIGIALVAPSGYAPDAESVERAIVRLQVAGFRVIRHFAAAEKSERFGATDVQRVAHLHAAASDPAVDLVLALRGGYGLSRILPQLDWPLLAASGKLFVGHSDFTAFQMGLLAQTGAISFAGPMLCDDFTRAPASQFTQEHCWQCLTSPRTVVQVDQDDSPPVNASGTLFGGNLAMVAHLVGTPYLPRIDGGILFLEDINEHPFRVERMLLQLLHAGVLANQSAIVLGDFSGYKLSEIDNGFCFESMLARLRAILPVPVLTGLPFGHIVDKVTLPVGAPATLVGNARGWTLSVSGYPTLAPQ